MSWLALVALIIGVAAVIGASLVLGPIMWWASREDDDEVER